MTRKIRSLDRTFRGDRYINDREFGSGKTRVFNRLSEAGAEAFCEARRP